MMRTLFVSILLFAVACRENRAPDSAAATTAAETTAATAGSVATAATSAPPAPPAVRGPKLQPVDEGTSDASFASYRDELLRAVRARDTNAVVALADPNIRTSFGDGGGSEDLRRKLGEAGMWETLEQLLSLGGTFLGEGENRPFWAPYVYSTWPDAHDAFQSMAVIAADVPLHESNDPSSTSTATLEYDIVTTLDSAAPGQAAMRHVKTADGRSGWVEASRLYSPVGYRAGFNKTSGRWRMTGLVAGD